MEMGICHRFEIFVAFVKVEIGRLDYRIHMEHQSSLFSVISFRDTKNSIIRKLLLKLYLLSFIKNSENRGELFVNLEIHLLVFVRTKYVS